MPRVSAPSPSLSSALWGCPRSLFFLWAACSLLLCGFVGWDWLSGSGGMPFEGADDTGYFIWLRSAVVSGEFDFRDDIAGAPTLAEATRTQWLTQMDAGGRVVNKYPPGWAMLHAPAFAVGHWIARLGGAEANGWSFPELFAVWVSQAVLALVGMLAAVRLAGRFAVARSPTLAFALIWLGSPLLYYQVARFAMVHGALFSLSALLWWLAFRVAERRERAWEWGLLGLSGGLLLALRPTAGAALLWPAWAVWLRLGPGNVPRPWARAAATGTAGLVPLLLSAWAVACARGGWFAEAYPGENFHWGDAAWWDVLFSPRHGVFHHSPVLLLGLAGIGWALVTAFRGETAPGADSLRRAWLVCAVASCALLYAANAAWWCWWFGSSFGNRAFDLWWLVAVVGMAHLLGALTGTRRRWLLACAWTLILVNVLWLCAWLGHAIPRADEVPYSHLADVLSASVGEMTKSE